MAALVAAACGSTNPTGGILTPSAPGASPIASDSPSPTATTSPVSTSHPTPKATSSQTANPCAPVATPPLTPSVETWALVSLRGGDCTIVRKITDINHPSTNAEFAQLSQPRFLAERTLTYLDGNSLFHVLVIGSRKTRVVTTTQGVLMYTWSPDRSTVVYATQSQPGTAAVHQLSGGRDRVIGTIPILLGAIGCETVASCAGADTWDTRLTYSPNGAYISLTENIGNVQAFRLWSSDGTLITSSDSQSRSMSVWSGDGFYYPHGSGVEVLRNGAVSLFLPGVNWIRPNVSPKETQIVYEVRDAQGWHHTFVVDTITKQTRELKKGRTDPVFLTSRYIWYRAERACAVSEGCDATHSATLSGKTYIYDLKDGTETESIITNVYDVWPHAGCLIRAECILANLS